MDRIIWSAEGYPLNREWLDFFENQSIEQINALVKAVGNNVIVSGITGELNALSDGLLIYNNELLPFVSGGNGPVIVIVEEVTEGGYDTAGTDDFSTILPLWKKRYCKLGNVGDANVVGSFNYSTLQRLDNIQRLHNNRLKRLKRGKLLVRFLNGDIEQSVVTGDFTEATVTLSSSVTSFLYSYRVYYDAFPEQNLIAIVRPAPYGLDFNIDYPVVALGGVVNLFNYVSFKTKAISGIPDGVYYFDIEILGV